MDILFWLVGALAVAFGLTSVTRRNPIYAAFFLLMAMGCVAIEFLLLHAPFLAAMQIILYAGAIVVLFVFVVMLLNLNEGEMGPEPDRTTKMFAAFVSCLTFVLLVMPALKTSTTLSNRSDDQGRMAPVPKEYKLRDIYNVVSTRTGVRQAEFRADKEGSVAVAAKWPEAKRERVKRARAFAAHFVIKFMPHKAVEAADVLAFNSAEKLKVAANQIEVKVAEVKVAGSEDTAPSDPVLAAKINGMQRTINIRAARYGSVEDIVTFLYSRYVVAFELVSILILAAVAGVVVLARRRGFMGMEVVGEKPEGGMFL